MRLSSNLAAVLSVTLATQAGAQSLASQLDRVKDGAVRLSVVTRTGVCGDGRFIGEETPDGFVTYTAWNQGYSIQSYEFFRPDCRSGPLRLVVVKAGGTVRELRAAVGVEWLSGATAPDLGDVDQQALADWLLDVGAATARDEVAIVAFLAANATTARITDRLLRIVNDRGVASDARSRAMSWVTGAADREGRGAEADGALRVIATASEEPRPLRDRAIRSLRETVPNDAFLRELYPRLDQRDLQDRVLRRLGQSHASDNFGWIRDRALDARESEPLRDRALRVIGDDLYRPSDVRALYPRLDRAALKDRALRIVAQHGDASTLDWLRGVAENRDEPLAARDRAVRLLGEQGAPQAVALKSLYGRVDQAELKDRILQVVAASASSDTRDWLAGIALDRSQAASLRDRALREVGQGLPSAELAKLYDALDTQSLKQRVMRLLTERKDDAAVEKLIAIARADGNMDLRRYAMRRLAETGHPKARAFLEESARRP